jgi:hypothetical protein
MKHHALWTILLPATLVACGAPATPANDSAAAGAAANEAAPPAGNAAPAGATGPLSMFVGHPSNQEVEGVLFTAHPLVRSAVEAAVADSAVRRWVLSEGTSGEIALRDGRLVSTACEPHNCGEHNWTVLIDPAGTSAEVCYADLSVDERVTWYAAGRPPEERQGTCPTASVEAAAIG